MQLYPAIDLKDGHCVRLLQGQMEQATVFSESPAQQARDFAEQGAQWLHVVDLNGAFEGHSVNSEAVEAIINAVDIPIQLGGGIRGLTALRNWFDMGIARAVLGTVALKEPGIVKAACREFPGKIVVGIDARGGKVAVEGWAEVSDVEVLDLARKFEDVGVAAILYTNVDRDGLMQGVDVEGTKTLAEAVRVPIIASGGVSSLEDLQALKAVESSGIAGAICGRAIYEGTVDVKQAVELLAA